MVRLHRSRPLVVDRGDRDRGGLLDEHWLPEQGPRIADGGLHSAGKIESSRNAAQN